ncbi:amino acid adenylation domain-containing protein [Gordonia sp. FQ]|uniref:amino acid adenylation domain-containing protein n=1 Tax=Gordonia sp. FQ TaxID=3446634 RepID=UPI003F85028C
MANDLSARKKELLKRRLEARGLRAAETPGPARQRAEGERTPMPAGLARLWFIGHRDPSDTTLNVGVAFALTGDVDAGRLRRAFGAVAARHQPLRATYDSDADGVPVMVHHDAVEVPWTEHDLSQDGPFDDETVRRRVRVLAQRDQNRPFDLRREPPLRVTLIRCADRHVLLFTVHHIAWDDESWRVLFDDLAAAYTGIEREPSPVAFADAAHPDAERIAADLDYWRRELSPVPAPLDLPPLPVRAAEAAPANGHVAVDLPPEVLERAAAVARTAGTTRFAVVAAATLAFLQRTFGTAGEDLLLAVPATTRPDGAHELIGYFGNSLLLRGTVTPETVFAELARDTGQRLADGLAASEAPIDQVVAALGRAGGDGLTGLVGASLSARSEMAPVPLGDAELTHLPELAATNSQLPVEFTLVDGGVPRLELEYDVRRFGEPVARGLVAALAGFLDAAVTAPDTVVRGLPLLTGPAREAALAAALGRPVRPGAHTLVDLLAAAVAARPAHPALVADTETLTYADLDERSNRLARWLLAQGVGPGDIVALRLPAGTGFVVAVLAVLKAGGAYLPVDPDYPADRIAFVLTDAAPALVLDAENAADPAAGFSAAPLTDDERGGPIAPESLAYVIYTSGSTGTPKGVGVEHRAIAEHLRAMDALGVVGPGDRMIQTSSVSFDASMFEIFATLTSGATLVLPRPKALTDIAYIASILVREQVTVMHMVPSLLSTLLLIPEVKQWTTLTTVPVGGEALAGDVADAFTTAFTAALSNNYGPTEAVVAATHFPVDGPQGGRTVPIGRPNPGVAAYLLDAALAPVPDGVVGEIYLGGDQLARGYLGRPGLTAERFVADPHRPGARMYRTGDLARRTASGDLEFAGRADGQVKIRGHRIELGEIEAVLAGAAGVARALVVVDRGGPDDRLLAYVVPGDPAADPEAILGHARASLPAPLVPDAVVLIDEVPVTVHGKLDLAALPVPDLAATEFRAPSTPAQERVAAVFATLFDAERIGVDDSFFALGGHSLLAARLVTALSAEFGVPVDVRLPFDHPTVDGLAAALTDLVAERLGVDLDAADDWADDWADDDFGGVSLGEVSPVEPTAPRAVTRPPLREVVADDPAPLAFSQLAMWFAHRFSGPSPAGHIPLAFTLDGPVDDAALGAALQRVVDRHPALRTSFHERAGLPVQRVADRAEPMLDVRRVDDIEAALAAAGAQTFDLEAAPLVRAALLRGADEAQVLSLVFHHLVVDHASVELIVDDLVAEYRAAAAGRPALPPYDGPSYRAYATWQHRLFGVAADPAAGGRYGQAELDHWRTRLAGIPDEILVAADRPRPDGLSRRAVIADTELTPDARARIRTVADRAGVSEFMAVTAALAATLTTLGGGTDVVIGTPSAGRDDPDTHRLVGLVADMVPLRNDLSGDPTLHDALRISRDAVLDAFAHQDTPIERLVEALNPRRTRARNPLFQTMIHFRDRSADVDGRPLSGDGSTTLTLRPMVMDTSLLDLNVMATVTADGGLHLRLVAAADLYDEDTAAVVADRLAAVLTAVGAAPETRLSALGLPGLPATLGPADHGDDPARLAALIAERAPRRVQARPATLAALPHTGSTHCPSVTVWIVDGPGAPDGLAETLRALAPSSHVIDNHGGATAAVAEAMPALGGEPNTPTQRALVTILAELVDVDGLGVDDNFFAVGGDSVISIQWCARAAAAGIALTPQQVFDCYTIAELAEAVDAAAAAASADPVAEVADEPAESAPMSASGLSADALSALGAAWEARR